MPRRSIAIAFLILLFFLSLILNITQIPILSGLIQEIAATPKSFLYRLRAAGEKNIDKRLSEENETLRKKLVEYERLKRDNLALRDQFEVGATSEFKLLPARILGSKGGLAVPRSLIIDQGERSGVKRGMAVVLANNLLGKVDKVSDYYSKVILTQNQEFSTLARTSETNALGMARGEGDFILLDQVSINDRVEEGQLLLTRGEINEQGFGIPPDLIIGKILDVDRNESLPNQSAKVGADIDVLGIDTIFIIVK